MSAMSNLNNRMKKLEVRIERLEKSEGWSTLHKVIKLSNEVIKPSESEIRTEGYKNRIKSAIERYIKYGKRK